MKSFVLLGTKPVLPVMPDLRLQAVKSFLELHLNNEEELKDLVYLASEICETPIASITLVDDEKQYPVIKIGDMFETSREVAFCSEAIKQTAIFEITDAHDDVRFVNNPLVTDKPNIRFYAGVPLVTADDCTIGTLCVIGQQPKKLTESQIKGLTILSKQVIHRLELYKNMKVLKDSLSDVYQNRELLEQAEVIKSAFYGDKDYFILLNTQFEIASFNDSMENFVRIHKKSQLQKGRKFVEYVSPTHRHFINCILNKAKEGESSIFELLAEGDNQDKIWIKFAVSPTYSAKKELIGIACIGYNIDKEKKQQQRIDLQLSTLSEIARLHSHEIRHPLTNILAIIDIIKKDDYKVSKEFINYLEIASKELDVIITKVVIDSHRAN